MMNQDQNYMDVSSPFGELNKTVIYQPHKQLENPDVAAKQKEKAALEQELSELQETCRILSESVQSKDKEILEAQQHETEREAFRMQELEKYSCFILPNETTRLNENIKKLETKTDIYRRLHKDYTKKLEEYDVILHHSLKEQRQLKDEIKTFKSHLSNIGVAIYDVMRKCNTNKNMIFAAKEKQDSLQCELNNIHASVIFTQGKYQDLKASSQIKLKELHNLFDKENGELRESQRSLSTTRKRLEIQQASLEEKFIQKEKECSCLSTLYDEYTANTKKNV